MGRLYMNDDTCTRKKFEMLENFTLEMKKQQFNQEWKIRRDKKILKKIVGSTAAVY